MSIQVTWTDDTQTSIYCQFIGKWTLDDLYQCLSACYEMQTDKDYVVDLIFDMTQSDGIPKNIMSINSYIQRNRQPDTVAVVITQNAFVRAMSETFMRLLKHEQLIIFAKDEADAMQKLASVHVTR